MAKFVAFERIESESPRPTLRDEIAMAALPSMLEVNRYEDTDGVLRSDCGAAALDAYKCADAMMEARDGA